MYRKGNLWGKERNLWVWALIRLLINLYKWNYFRSCFSPGLIWFCCTLMVQHRKARGVCSWKSHWKLLSLVLSVVMFTTTPSRPFLFWKKLQREKAREGILPVKFQISSGCPVLLQRQELWVPWVTLGSLSSVLSQVMVAITRGGAHDPEGPVSLSSFCLELILTAWGLLRQLTADLGAFPL